MKRTSLLFLVIAITVLAFYISSTPLIKDMTVIYSAKITQKNADTSEILAMVNEISERYLMKTKADIYDNKELVAYELSNADMSLLFLPSMGQHKLYFRVSANYSEDKAQDVFISIQELFSVSKNLSFEETEVKVYDTRPGNSLHPEKNSTG